MNLTTDKPFGAHFAFYPEYSISMEYEIEPDGSIILFHASIRPKNSNYAVSVASTLHAELTRFYRADMLAQAGA